MRRSAMSQMEGKIDMSVSFLELSILFQLSNPDKLRSVADFPGRGPKIHKAMLFLRNAKID